MNIRNITNDIGFDISQAIAAVDAYSDSTGIGCMIIDIKGQTLYEKYGKKSNCNFCKDIKGILEGHQSCANAHLYGSYQAERFGGKYIFFLPHGSCTLGVTHYRKRYNERSSTSWAGSNGRAGRISYRRYFKKK
jgi:ligand-binding sensor protein